MLALTINLESLEMQTELTSPLCPVNDLIRVPDNTSQTFIDLSSLPLTINLESLEMQTEQT